ncbi:glycosyltransferase family 2 protein [Actinomadura rugatobispora]|uniref:Glycosyltransferase family 2 protein n=1 Tax=Actinomadura rugatobispora TaxID=1994 RepID=A0ABW1AJK5_9ACTN
MGTPKVSVIVPVHDCRSTLERTFRSVFDQTMPAGRIEIIAVDDGSTDGSGEELDRLAVGRSGFTVVHQPPSGGPGRPRNAGIERAAGEYVFFLDADDYLGPEALERCCAMADRNETDVVVPKYVGIGRKVNPYLFRETVEFTTIHDEVPNLYGSITALKLYRRSLLERHRIRFPENVLSGEDQFFAVRAYFEAKGVSVLSDYDCYYWVDRDDGSSALQRGGAPAADYFPEIRRLMAFVAERTGPGPARDRLMRRHFGVEVFSRFDQRYQGFGPDERRATRDGARELVERWATPEILERLNPYNRLLAHALRHGLDDLVDEAARVHAGEEPQLVVDGERAFAAYPGFRDEALGIPDEVFLTSSPLSSRRTLTGAEWRDGRLAVLHRAGAVEGAAGGHRSELLLRRREGGEEHRVPFRPVPADDALIAEIDFAATPLAPGRWDAHAVIRVQDRVAGEGRLVAADGVEPPGARITAVRGGRPVVAPYLTKSVGALALHVGGKKAGAAPATPAAVSAGPSGTLRIAATLTTALPGGAGDRVGVRVLLRHRESGEVRAAEAVAAAVPGGVDVSAELDLRGARRGAWDASYEVAVDGAKGEFRIPLGSGDAAAPAGRRGPRPFRTSSGNLSVQVGGAVVTRLRRVLSRRS